MKYTTIQRGLTLAASIAMLGLASLLSSCNNKEDQLFDKPANERVTIGMEALKKQLVASENGWVMDYYPHEQKIFGGYVIALKFTDKNEVLAASEAYFKDKEGKNKPIEWVKSLYTIGNDRAITLNFSTYNKAIHVYSDPDLPYGEGRGSGLGGDHEFLLMTSDNPDVIVLEGKKTHNTIRLHRAKESLESYMESIRACKDKVFSNKLFMELHKDSFRGMIKGREAIFTPSEDGFNTYTVFMEGKKTYDGEGNLVKDVKEVIKDIPFHYTPTGVMFDEPFEGIKGFTWSEADACFLADGVKFTAHDDPDWPYFKQFLGEWSLRIFTGEKAEDFDVTFETRRRNVYIIKGLPGFDLEARFDSKYKRFFINCQIVGGVTRLYAWAAEAKGMLTYDEEIGMYAELAEGSSNVYDMHDNGAWGSYKVDSFIFWGDKGEDKRFKISRLQLPRFKKK